MPSQYISTVVRCAAPNCDHVKRDVNHWWICHITDRFLVKPWDDDAVFTEDNILPLCGNACVVKMMQIYLSGQKTKSTTIGIVAQGGPVE